MRRPILLLAAIVTLAIVTLAIVTLYKSDYAKCADESAGDPDLQIDYCTRVIDSGDLSNGKLAYTFHARGGTYYHKGQYDRAIADYDEAIRLKPDNAYAYNSFAWLLATTPDTELRDGRKAVTLATKAVHLNDTAQIRDTLAAAYAEARRFIDAVAEQERAIEMLRAAGASAKEIADLQSRLDLYRRRQAYRE